MTESAIATIPQDEAPTRREAVAVMDPIPVLDTARFEHMQRIASAMARSSLIPESLYMAGPKEKRVALPSDTVLANCFLVVNQAVRWGMDPFAVAQCVSVVHGKLLYEGKLVSAVLDAKLGIRLHHLFVGKAGTDDYRIFLSDKPFDTPIMDEDGPVPLAEVLLPGLRLPQARLLDGSVGEWKTAGAGTPWTPKNYPRMLLYRGTRDWARTYESAVMLGVYTDDEMVDLAENARAQRARPISLADRLQGGRSEQGFRPAQIDAETAEQPAADDSLPPAIDPDEPATASAPDQPDEAA